MRDARTYCEEHGDKRVFSHQSTDRGEIVNVYADDWTPNCRIYVGTGKYVRDGHRPERTS
jgi:hypothetical protein